MALRKILMIVFLFLVLPACEQVLQQMGSTEYGLRFRKLPPRIGGGVSKSVIAPGQMIFVWPWDSIYRFDTSVQDISWGAEGRGDDPSKADYVRSRALDGNEVALAVTVRYKTRSDGPGLIKLVQEVATSDEEVRDLVVSIARADIRTYMNQLKTSEFLKKKDRYDKVDEARTAIAARLEHNGVLIRRVNLDDFRFERVLKSGELNTEYEERLREIQRVREETEREKLRVRTVVEAKTIDFNEMKARVNRLVAESKGYKKQAQFRGDAYLEARSNRAKGILARGQAEVKGLIEQINALSGPGGQAILKLELAQALLKNDPRFVLIGETAGSGGLEVKRVDANDLLNQIGVLEGLAPKQKPVAVAPKLGVQIRPVPPQKLKGDGGHEKKK